MLLDPETQAFQYPTRELLTRLARLFGMGDDPDSDVIGKQ
jgi:hypothetical protein